jgi:Surface-adhesin protein E
VIIREGNGVKVIRQRSRRKWGIFLASVMLTISLCADVRGDDWVFYCASGREETSGSALNDWYGLNRLTCRPKTGASSYHYYDRDSLAPSSPFPGGIVRVWEKSVLQKETESYEEAREAIAKEEEIRRKRKISELDYAWLFPMAVNRAAKETATLFEIDCDSKKFMVLEGNHYDKAGKRMTREATFDMELWLPIQPQTVMEALYRNACRE